MKDISVARHDLHTVRTGFPCAPRRMSVAADKFLDFRDSHPPGAQSIKKIRLIGRAWGKHADEFFARDVALPAGKVKLNDVPAIVLVNFLDERAPGRDRAVIVDTRVSGDRNTVGADTGI